MSRKRCIRKHYGLINPIAHAMAGAAYVDKASIDKLRLLELSAIEAFAKGRATQSDWRAIADMCNVAQTMASDGIGPEALPVCESVESALQAAHARYLKHGRLGMTGPDLVAMRELYELHDLQRATVCRSDYERAIEKTANRIRSAHPTLKVMV